MRQITWIKEEQAAELVGYKPRQLRKKVQTGEWDISFTNMNGRRFQYSEKDIQKVLLKNAKLI